MKAIFSILLILFSIAASLQSCKKSVFLSKKNISFSLDTLVFDTIFTTIGSTTKQFKIYNRENKTVRIDQIELMGGSSSPFRINIDGLKGSKFSSIEIEGKDSLFAFIEVTLSINGGNLPMVIEDSIRFRTNGMDQYVKLAVWGQDAYFHYSNFQAGILDINEGFWPNDKPHVIYGAAIIDSSKTLTISAGTDVYLHKNAMMYVYKGSLKIEGTLGNEVTFQGDRLETLYDDVTGQYYGIYFHEAIPSKIDYAIIKNGTSGIHMYSRNPVFSGYTLQMTNTIIENNARYGVFLYSGSRLKAENCVIAKNGLYGLLVLEGSDFVFNYCNLLGYGSDGKGNPVVGISNYYNDKAKNTVNVGSINEGKIYNSVIYGNEDNEIIIDTLHNPAISLNFDLQNCVIKTKNIPPDNFYKNIVWNGNPLFNDISAGDYLFPNSSALNNGAKPSLAPSIQNDIRGFSRSSTSPDIGAYEN